MKYTYALLTGAAVVAAQSLSDLPACGVSQQKQSHTVIHHHWMRFILQEENSH